jgi:hypothetical protein
VTCVTYDLLNVSRSPLLSSEDISAAKLSCTNDCRVMRSQFTQRIEAYNDNNNEPTFLLSLRCTCCHRVARLFTLLAIIIIMNCVVVNSFVRSLIYKPTMTTCAETDLSPLSPSLPQPLAVVSPSAEELASGRHKMYVARRPTTSEINFYG